MIRIKRLAGDLRTRRRRLDVYRNSPSWPGKDIAWRSELIRYDHCLVVAAQMLDAPGIETEPGPLAAEARVVLRSY